MFAFSRPWSACDVQVPYDTRVLVETAQTKRHCCEEAGSLDTICRAIELGYPDQILRHSHLYTQYSPDTESDFMPTNAFGHFN